MTTVPTAPAPVARPAPRVLLVTTVDLTLRTFLLPLAAHFRALGWRVDALASGATQCEACRGAFDQVTDAPWSRNPFDWRNMIKAPRVLSEAIAAGRYDLVHVHTPVASFITRLAIAAVRRAGRPTPVVIYTAHGFHFFRGGNPVLNLAFLALEKLAAAQTDWLVVINEEDAQAAVRHRLVAPDRLMRLPGVGVDLARYGDRPPADALRAELGLPADARVFTVVAELVPRKRHLDALEAFARLADPNAYLVLAGEGPLLHPLQARARALGVADRVRFLGWRDDVPTLLAASTAVLLPSAQEGLPRTVMEAMCQGLPVIASRIRGVTDLLGDDHALLFPVGDVGALTAQLRRVSEAPAWAAAIGARGQDRVAPYDLAKVTHLYEDLYDRALGHENRVPHL